MKTYKQCITFPTFEERFEYLKLDGAVGLATFGSDRYLNQIFYNSPEWKTVRRDVILRDNGCDLGIPDRIVRGRIYIHHLNPISVEDVLNRSSKLFDPDNLICVSRATHEAIHYGDFNLLNPSTPLERKPFDQAPWRTA